MSFRRVSDAPIGVQPTTVAGRVEQWVRPGDWLPVDPPAPTDNKFVALLAVHDNDSNRVAFRFTVTGGYRVDWGDGTAAQNIATAVTAEHSYDFASLPASALTSRGYKQVRVTVVPQTAAAFTAISLQYRPTGYGAYVNTAPWLDIAISAPGLTSLVLGASTMVVYLSMLERVRLLSHSLVSASYAFAYLYGLRQVEIAGGATLTSCAGMFRGCTALTAPPVFVTSNVTSFSYMFAACTALRTVPYYDTSKGIDFSYMFSGATLLERLPTFNTSKATTVAFMFSTAASLITVPAFDFGKVVTTSSFVASARSIRRIPVMGLRVAADLRYLNLGPLALNELYAGLVDLTASIGNATGNGTTVTFTTTAPHNLYVGLPVTVSGVDPVTFNIAGKVAAVPNMTSFTITNAATGVYNSGGSVKPTSLALQCSGAWGFTTSNQSIATAKGWVVS